MKATILVSGPQASGKSTWLDQVKQALLATEPLEAVEVRLCEGPRQMPLRVTEYQHDEFTIPGADAEDGAQGAAGDRETWSVDGDAALGFRVYEGAQWQASFKHEPSATLFMRFASAPFARRMAVEAVLKGSSFWFDGDYAYYNARRPAENCRGGGGDFADAAGAISAAEAPAIHGLDEDYDPLREAALNLYSAGAWQLYGPSQLSPSMQERLWSRLRDALGLPPGTATSAGKTLKDCIEKFPDGANLLAWPSPAKAEPEPAVDESAAHDFALEQLGQAWDMLETAADVFDQYADEHFAKDTPESLVKGNRNARMARMCRNTVNPLVDAQDVAKAA